MKIKLEYVTPYECGRRQAKADILDGSIERFPELITYDFVKLFGEEFSRGYKEIIWNWYKDEIQANTL